MPAKNSDFFSIRKMSKKTFLPIPYIKSILEIPIEGKKCNASNSEQAKALYNKAKMGSEKQAIMFERWNKLSLTQVRRAKTLSNSKLAYENSPPNSEARELGLKKYIGFITEIKDAQAIYYSIQNNTKLKSIAFRRLDGLVIKKVKSAKTFKETQTAYYLSLEGSKAQFLAIKKMATFFGWKPNV